MIFLITFSLLIKKDTLCVFEFLNAFKFKPVSGDNFLFMYIKNNDYKLMTGLCILTNCVKTIRILICFNGFYNVL